MRVETTFAGAGVISGDLTPECAAIVTAVLESLSAPPGAEDTRTREQRYHDALEEAMRRLAASGLLPERAGAAGQGVGAYLSGHDALGPAAAQPAGQAFAGPSGLEQLPGLSQEAIQQAIIGKAADLMSGPGGLASFLRTRQLGARLAGPSRPLDIGYATTIPPGIRNAVILRDRKCRWPGGCHQPAAACQVHHIKHLAHGRPTSLDSCVLLCSFHHQVVIHRWGWTLTLNPDGTTTATNPDHTKTLHSHSPPARAG